MAVQHFYQSNQFHTVTGADAFIIGGNTSGTTAIMSAGTINLMGGNNVTLSQVGNNITFSVANQSVQTQNLHNVTLAGNTAGVLAQVSSGTLTLAGGNNITLSQAGNAVTISAAAAGAGAVINRSMIEIMEGERFTTVCPVTGASFSKRPILVPFWLDGENLSVKTIRFFASRAAGTSLNMTYGAALYSLANSTQLSRAVSTTHAISLTASAQFSGVRGYEATGMSTFTLSEGRWYLGLYFSGSNDSTAVANLVLMGGDVFTPAGWVFPGTNQTSATASSLHMYPFWGVYSNTTGAFPNSIARSEIMGGNSGQAADIYAAILEI